MKQEQRAQARGCGLEYKRIMVDGRAVTHMIAFPVMYDAAGRTADDLSKRSVSFVRS